MLVEVKAPELSESVQSGALLEWRKQEGDTVRRDETLVDLETDKVILEVAAPAAGVLKTIHMPAGTEVKAGDVLAIIEVGEVSAAEDQPKPEKSKSTPVAAKPAPASPPPAAAAPKPQPPAPPVQPAPEPTKAVTAPAPAEAKAPAAASVAGQPERGERRVQMSRLRQRIAERLKEAQNTAAMLTTFNEVNMQPVQELRKRYQEHFQKEHGVKLGLMSFFVKAVCQGLKAYPVVNASMEGRDFLYHDYYDVGVAVSSERGLVVPILRDADRLSFAEIERRIADFGRRANSLELTMEELEGGTFTISNGGIFGSLLSTPILNPPQSGVLGLHKIQERPVAENGQVVIRPMMYVALSYDHRIIDGREAVSFLRVVKEGLEEPARLLLEL